MNRGFPRLPTSRPGRLAVLLAAVALAAVACAGEPATSDPYELAAKAADASYDQVKVQVGLEATGEGTDVSIPPEAVELVLDTKAGKGSFHLALPLAALGDDAAALGAFGVTGDTLDLDVLFDGEAAYAKSPLAATLLPMLMAQTGGSVSGDLNGWLKLGTAAEFAAIGDLLGSAAPGATASPGALSDLDAAQLKADLEESGAVLAYAGTETRNGVESNHLTLTVDPEKLADSPMLDQVPVDQLGQLEGLANAGEIKADLWLDKGSGRLNEVRIAGSGADGTAGAITILVTTPDGVSFEAPATATDVSLVPLLMSLMQTFGGSFLPGT